MDLARGITGLVGFLRFKDWIHFLPLVLLPVRGPFVEPRTLALSLGAASGGLAFAFGFNLFSDDALDRKPESYLVERYGMTLAKLRGALATTATLALTLAAALGPVAAVAMAILLLAAYTYSGGPRLKRLPVVGTLMNVPIFAPLGLLADEVPTDFDFLSLVAAFVGLVIQVQLIHEICHADEDRADDLRTTALLIGAKAARNASALVGLVPVAIFILLGFRHADWRLGLCGVASLGLQSAFLAFTDISDRHAAERARIGLRLSGLFVGGIAWALLLVDQWTAWP